MQWFAHENPLHMVCYRSICDFFKKLRVQHHGDQLTSYYFLLYITPKNQKVTAYGNDF
jgi:hypothetical protein